MCDWFEDFCFPVAVLFARRILCRYIYNFQDLDTALVLILSVIHIPDLPNLFLSSKGFSEIIYKMMSRI